MVKLPKVAIDTDLSRGQCFGCGQNNPLGLKLRFDWDGQTASAKFTPGKHHQGWNGIVHGGLISCMLDEAMTYAAHFTGVESITARMNVSFKHPALVNEILVIKSCVIRKTRRLIETNASIFSPDGTVVAEADGTHFVVGAAAAAVSK